MSESGGEVVIAADELVLVTNSVVGKVLDVLAPVAKARFELQDTIWDWIEWDYNDVPIGKALTDIEHRRQPFSVRQQHRSPCSSQPGPSHSSCPCSWADYLEMSHKAPCRRRQCQSPSGWLWQASGGSDSARCCRQGWDKVSLDSRHLQYEDYETISILVIGRYSRV